MVRRDAEVRSGPALLAKRFSEVRSEANASAQRGGYSFAFIRVIRGYKSDQVRFGQQPKPTPKGFGVLPGNENGRGAASYAKATARQGAPSHIRVIRGQRL